MRSPIILFAGAVLFVTYHQANSSTVSLNAVSGVGSGSVTWTTTAATVGDALKAVDSLKATYAGKNPNRRLYVPVADTTVTSSDVIYSVKVRIRARSDIDLSGTYDGLKVGINLNGTDYPDPAIDEQRTVYSYYEHSWLKSPATNAAWTWTEVNAVQAGCVTAKTARSQSTTYAVDHAQIVVNFGPASNTAPVAAAVAVAGEDTVGDILTGSFTYSDADGDAQGISRLAWYRADDTLGTNKAAITGVTGTTCVIPPVAEGKYVTFEVTPVASSGVSEGAPVESRYFGPIKVPTGAAPVAATVAIAGLPLVSEPLAGSYTYSDADGDIESGSLQRWLRDGVAIAGATSATYTLTEDDFGTMIQFEVTPIAATGTPMGGIATLSAAVGPIDRATATAHRATTRITAKQPTADLRYDLRGRAVSSGEGVGFVRTGTAGAVHVTGCVR